MNNFCSKCGTPLKDNAKFCSACGTKVETENFVPTPISPESQEHYEEFNSPPIQNQNAGLYATFYDTFLKKEGRLNRWRYFKRSFVVNMVFSILSLPLTRYSDRELANPSNELSLYIIVIFGLQIYFLYCLSTRRLHDLNYNSTLAVLLAVCTVLVNFDIAAMPLSIAAILASIFLMFKRGSVGPNKYGADPLADKNY